MPAEYQALEIDAGEKPKLVRPSSTSRDSAFALHPPPPSNDTYPSSHSFVISRRAGESCLACRSEVVFFRLMWTTAWDIGQWCLPLLTA
eukprot:614899-Amorphochlora_amoeboformis.AAC.1